MRLEDYSALIEQIYGCALVPDRWPETLGAVAQALGGFMGDISRWNPATGRGAIFHAYNWPEGLPERAAAAIDAHPLAYASLVAPLGEPFVTSREIDLAALHRTAFHSSLFEEVGRHDYMAVPLARNVTEVSFWGVGSDRDKGVFDDDDIALARLLAPHVKRAAEISGLVERERALAASLEAALDRLDAATLILTRRGQIAFANEPARGTLERRDVFVERGGVLHGANAEARKMLAAMIATGHARGEPRCGDCELPATDGSVLRACWVELNAPSRSGGNLLLVLRRAEAELVSPLAAATRLYGLTRAETQVLAQIVRGVTTREAAALLGLSPWTVKTHLASLFRKTGTHRRSALVGLVASLAPPLG